MKNICTHFAPGTLLELSVTKGPHAGGTVQVKVSKTKHDKLGMVEFEGKRYKPQELDAMLTRTKDWRRSLKDERGRNFCSLQQQVGSAPAGSSNSHPRTGGHVATTGTVQDEGRWYHRLPQPQPPHAVQALETTHLAHGRPKFPTLQPQSIGTAQQHVPGAFSTTAPLLSLLGDAAAVMEPSKALPSVSSASSVQVTVAPPYNNTQ